MTDQGRLESGSRYLEDTREGCQRLSLQRGLHADGRKPACQLGGPRALSNTKLMRMTGSGERIA